MPSEDEFRLEFDPGQLAGFLRALKSFEPDLATATRRNLRRAGDDTVGEMRRTVASGPGGGGPVQSGIQRGLRTAVRTGKYRQGVVMTGSSSAIPEGHKAMLRLYNKRSWRHPVFGDRRRWVVEHGRPYFGSVIKRHEDDMVEAIWRALSEAINRMAVTR